MLGSTTPKRLSCSLGIREPRVRLNSFTNALSSDKLDIQNWNRTINSRTIELPVTGSIVLIASLKDVYSLVYTACTVNHPLYCRLT